MTSSTASFATWNGDRADDDLAPLMLSQDISRYSTTVGFPNLPPFNPRRLAEVLQKSGCPIMDFSDQA